MCVLWEGKHPMRMSRWLLVLIVVIAVVVPSAYTQTVPCAAITRNPLVLEALLDSHSNDAEPAMDDTIASTQLERLQFNAIVIQPGDALYVEYKGRDFTVHADFASGDMTAFDSSPKGSYEQWRKGILPLDVFREALQQKLTRLRAVAQKPDQVFFRNIKIIRAGRPVFEFAKLTSYGHPQVRTAVQKQLPCVGFDDVPGSGNARAVNYSMPNNLMPQPFAGGLAVPMLPPFPMMVQGTTTPSVDGNHYKFTGKELDDETGLYNYGARYYSPGIGRYMTPDWSAKPVPIPYANFKDPQTLNLYSYVRNNPTSLPDPDGHAIQLSNDEEKRQQQLAAAQQAVGKDAGKYLYDNVDKNGNHYIGIYSKGPDGKGADFKDLNGAASKLNGVIQDSRIATVVTVSPGTNVAGPSLSPNGLIGSTDNGMSPGGSRPISQASGNEVVYLTSGDPGKLDPSVSSTHQPAPITLGDVFSHEMGHVFARWFGGDSNSSSVQMENDTRRLNGEPTRTGHDPNPQ
jgi:RHS repeat-associated protein